MQSVRIVKSAGVPQSVRLVQVAGLFDLGLPDRSVSEWDVHLDLSARPWSIGLVTGPSGSGKSTIAEHFWPDDLVRGFDWPHDASIIDAFPAECDIKSITGALCSVGFSSPPSWLRPWHCLSTGERFRADLARALCAGRPLIVYDEFTSVVDRVVAKSASYAVAKAVRRAGQRFVAVSCHDDIVDWLQPDWVYRPAGDELTWRCLQRRPAIDLTIRRVDRTAWRVFKPHHYLSGHLKVQAQCFAVFWGDDLVAFQSILPAPGGRLRNNCWREHRLVCLPDYQGVGIGSAVSEWMGATLRATGRRFRSRTAHPGLIQHRMRSPLWRMSAAYGYDTPKNTARLKRFNAREPTGFLPLRYAATFEYVGSAAEDRGLARAMVESTTALRAAAKALCQGVPDAPAGRRGRSSRQAPAWLRKALTPTNRTA